MAGKRTPAFNLLYGLSPNARPGPQEADYLRLTIDYNVPKYFGTDPQATNGLVYGWFGGIADHTGTMRPGGTVAVSPNATHYFEVSLETGEVTYNTVGFTEGLSPLAIVQTNDIEIVDIQDCRNQAGAMVKLAEDRLNARIDEEVEASIERDRQLDERITYEVTTLKDYVDTQDAVTLASAKQHADDGDKATLTAANLYTDDKADTINTRIDEEVTELHQHVKDEVDAAVKALVLDIITPGGEIDFTEVGLDLITAKDAEAAREALRLGALATEDCISYSGLADIPSAFTPVTHTHVMADITDFKGGGAADSVDWSGITNVPIAFPPESHTHNLNDVLGEIDIQWEQVSGNLIVSWSGVEDKPSAFPPESHGHGWGDISATPSAYPPEYHKHSMLDVEGWSVGGDGTLNIDMTWGAIVGKPETFPPVHHTHKAADIPGMVTEHDIADCIVYAVAL